MDKNIEAFLKMEKELIAKHHGKVVVFYKGKLVAINKDFRKAMREARTKTKGREFFVHELYAVEEINNVLPTTFPAV